ncbi:hypothetical protein T4D_1392 [Trichinella pseudospiralis]|uniref:Uncharacterized protein n=1 Tax=Trichinella pseudospiralis TaxID=6337 RepID=A0A0V1DP52_TRIPS|nr:hypothetical protein T4D_1392 [Trichinella pseudospiralis]
MGNTSDLIAEADRKLEAGKRRTLKCRGAPTT